MATLTATYDVVIYGGRTGNGFMQVIAFNRACKLLGIKKTVAYVCEGEVIGGYLGRVLADSDIGNALAVSGGIYNELCVIEPGRILGYPSNKYDWSPKHIQRVFRQKMLESGRVSIYSGCQLVAGSVVKSGGSPNYTQTITFTSGVNNYVLTGAYWGGADPDGDLLMQTGVENTDWTLGTESVAAYGESHAGHRTVPSYVNIPPYQTPGVPYAQIMADPLLAVGAASPAVQVPGIRAVFSRRHDARAFAPADPDTYDPAPLDLEALMLSVNANLKYGGIIQGKYVINNNFVINNTNASLGTVGVPLHFIYHKNTYANRRLIETIYYNWVKDYYYFMQTDAGRRGSFQTALAPFGMPPDEFIGNDFYPEIYFREGPRAIGPYVTTQMDIQITDTAAPRNSTKTDSIAGIVYAEDGHHNSFQLDGSSTTRFWSEGLGVHELIPSGACLPYRSILLKEACSANTAMGYCISTTHVGWRHIRILHQLNHAEIAGGAAMAIALHGSLTSLHAVNTTTLRQMLRDDFGQPTEPPWKEEQTYYVGQIVFNKANTYEYTTAGVSASEGAGPVGTGTGIADGTAVCKRIAT